MSASLRSGQPLSDLAYEKDRSQLERVDMTEPLDEYDREPKDYVRKNRVKLMNNLKTGFIKPLTEIKYYKIFDINSKDIRINFRIIRALNFEVLKQIEGDLEQEDREEYINHLWKIPFAIPPIYQGKIKGFFPNWVSKSGSSSKGSKAQSSGSRAKATDQISDVKYALAPIAKDEFDEDVSDMEQFIYKQMKYHDLRHVSELLSELLINCFNSHDVAFEDHEGTFSRIVEASIIEPVLKLFKFVHGERFIQQTRTVTAQEIIRNSHVYPDIIITKRVDTRPLTVVEIKKLSLVNNYLEVQNQRTIDLVRERRIFSQLVIYMMSTEQRFGFLCALSGLILLELPLGSASELYNRNENTLRLRHTIIKTVLLESEGPVQTLYNQIEGRTCLALVLFKNLYDKQTQTAQSEKRVKELHQMIQNEKTKKRKDNLDQSLQQDINAIRKDSSQVIPEWEGEENSEANDFMSETNPSSSTSSSGMELKPGLMEVKGIKQWYKVLRSSSEGPHLNEVLEINKSTFVELFKPSSEELQLVNNCQGSQLILKCYTDECAHRYFQENFKEFLHAHPTISNSYNYFLEIVSKHFVREVKANIAIMEHNMLVNKKYPSHMINSPMMIKFGGIADDENVIYGKYILFQALNKSNKLNTEKVSNLRDEQKSAIRREIQKLHSFLKISHGDIAARNLFFDIEKGIARLIDFESSRSLTPENSEYLISLDWEQCEQMLSGS